MIGLVIGIFLGWLVGYLDGQSADHHVFGIETATILALFRSLSTLFLNLIKSIIAPLIFATLVIGISGTGDIKQVGRIGAKSLLYFEIVTTLALVVGLAAVNITRPGDGVSLAGVAKGEDKTVLAQRAQTLSKEATEAANARRAISRTDGDESERAERSERAVGNRRAESRSIRRCRRQRFDRARTARQTAEFRRHHRASFADFDYQSDGGRRRFANCDFLGAVRARGDGNRRQGETDYSLVRIARRYYVQIHRVRDEIRARRSRRGDGLHYRAQRTGFGRFKEFGRVGVDALRRVGRLRTRRFTADCADV